MRILGRRRSSSSRSIAIKDTAASPQLRVPRVPRGALPRGEDGGRSNEVRHMLAFEEREEDRQLAGGGRGGE